MADTSFEKTVRQFFRNFSLPIRTVHELLCSARVVKRAHCQSHSTLHYSVHSTAGCWAELCRRAGLVLKKLAFNYFAEKLKFSFVEKLIDNFFETESAYLHNA